MLTGIVTGRKPATWSASLVLCLALGGTSCASNPDEAKRKAVESGDRYVASRNFNEAIIEYRRAIQNDALFGEAHSKLAKTYLAIGDGNSAYGEIMRAADLLPDDVDAQLLAGRVLLLGGKFEDAKQRALALLNKNPKNVDAQILLGNALAGLKDLDGAITQIETAIDMDPRRTLSYANLGALELAKGNRASAEQAFKRAVTVDPKSEVAHLALANYYWAGKEIPAAEQELKTAVSLNPKSVIANQAIATFYVTEHRLAEAEQYLKAAASLVTDIGPTLTLADFYLSAARDKDARAVLEKLTVRADGFVPARMRLAGIDYAAGNRQAAHEAVAAILQRAPKDEPTRVLNVRFLLSEKKNTEALALAKSIVEANPQSVPGHFHTGVALETTGDADGAMQEYREVLKISQAVVPAQVALARLYLARGDATAAASFAAQAIRTQPASGSAHLFMARAMLAQGNLKYAESELQLILNLAGAPPEVHTTMASLYLAKHDVPLARQSFAKALQIDPMSVDALAGLINIDVTEKKFADARRRVEARLAIDPRNPQVLLLAGSTYSALGDPQRAEAAFRQVITIDPSNLEAYGRLALKYVAERRLDEAKGQFEELARREVKPVGATTMTGMILEIQQKPEEARKKYEQALAIDPEAPIAANNLAMLIIRFGGNLDLALNYAQTAKRSKPADPDVSDTLGLVYIKKGLASSAVPLLEQSTAVRPSEPEFWLHLGQAYVGAGNKEKARDAFRHALKLNPKFGGASEARKALEILG